MGLENYRPMQVRSGWVRFVSSRRVCLPKSGLAEYMAEQSVSIFLCATLRARERGTELRLIALATFNRTQRIGHRSKSNHSVRNSSGTAAFRVQPRMRSKGGCTPSGGPDCGAFFRCVAPYARHATFVGISRFMAWCLKDCDREIMPKSSN